MKCIYPAIFTWIESDKVYSVVFPDIEGCFTYGYNLPEAFEYATDVLNLTLKSAEEDGDEIPPASKIEDIKLPNEKSFAQYIFADTDTYKKFLKFIKHMGRKKMKRAEKFIKSA